MDQISLFASNAVNIRKQGSLVHKLPREKQLLAALRDSATAAVVIIGHTQQQQSWKAWHQPCVGLVVASEVPPGDTLLKACWMPITHGSQRCHMGIVRTEMQAIERAISWYPSARVLYVVTADSLPVKSPAYYASPPAVFADVSVIGAAPVTDGELKKFSVWFYGSQ